MKGKKLNDGFVNEEELKDYINNNQYNQYNNNIKSFLKFLFQDKFNPALPFIAQKEGGTAKPDLLVEHNGIEKHISIKKGSGNSVHQEKIEVFFPYFEEILGHNLLNNLKLFHYGDDTINDTGAHRYNAAECKERYSKEISELNASINDPEILPLFLDRFLFIGNASTLIVDAIYYGTIEDGLWATQKEVLNYILSHNFSLSAVHFGPLTYQVWGRNENRTAAHPDRRYVMQIKWGSIVNDLSQIRQEQNE